MNPNKFSKLLRISSMQGKVFALLKTKKWICRGCHGASAGSGQYAGGGGIQGLERGTHTRPGLQIESQRRPCRTCTHPTLQDRWTGKFTKATAHSTISQKLQHRILKFYEHRDAIEGSKRPAAQLIVDHRFPANRWGATETKNLDSMTNGEIQQKFQLLKKDSSGNHNQLKSRACEKCFTSGERGSPLGILFWYKGSKKWPKRTPAQGPSAEIGCIGCGWYDFDKWRRKLNERLSLCRRRLRMASRK